MLFKKISQFGCFPNSVGDVVRKSSFCKALAAGVFSLSLIGGPAAAAGKSACPAFTSAMIDSAAMVALLAQGNVIVNAKDDITPVVVTECQISKNSGVGVTFRSFTVEVNDDEIFVTGRADLGNGLLSTILRSDGRGETAAVLHACRAQVLQSFVWNQ